MNCYLCKNHSKFICNCISPNVFICNDHLDRHMSGPGNHTFRISTSVDSFPILIKDLKMIRVKIVANSHLEIKKIQDQINNSIKEINSYSKNLQKNTNLFPILFNDLKMLRVKITANSYLEIKKILLQANNSIAKINNCIKSLKKNSDTTEITLFEMICGLKNLKFVNFENSASKYFYQVLEDEDVTYKGTIGFKQNDVFIKEGKGNKAYKDGRFFEGQWKNDKVEGMNKND